MASTSVLILAGGDETRWTASGGTGSKMLVRVAGGELLLPRAVRMLRERRVEPAIVAWHPDIKALYAAAFMPNNHRWIVETALDLRPLWGDSLTVFLLGDVLYSEELLRRALHSHHYMTVWGNDQEIFAVSVPATKADRWETALREAVVHAESGAMDKSSGKLWTAYRAYIGAPLDVRGSGAGNVFAWVPPYDPTCDFDYLREYTAYLEGLAA